MKKSKHIKTYTAAELRAKKGQSRTNLKRVDSISEKELARLIAKDKDEALARYDWTKAKLVMPEPKQDVHLRLEKDIIGFYKSLGKGHISKMQAVLKAYAAAHR